MNRAMKGYHEILLAEPAVRAIRSINSNDPVAARFIVDSLEYLSTDVDSGALRMIDKESGLMKTAVGDFDVLCWMRHEEMSIVVLAVSRNREPS